jgi:hypothetical protein
MLLFLDESYEADGAGRHRHVYAGFGVDEKKYRSLVVAVHQCRQKYFLQNGTMAEEERHTAKATHIVTSDPPELAEIKGTVLLARKYTQLHSLYGNVPGLLMVAELFDALAEAEATIFVTLSKPITITELQDGATCLPLYLHRLLERANLWMREQHPDGAAIVVLDTVSYRVDHHLSKHMADFLFRSVQGKLMRHIVPNPFWVDSRTTAGTQIADLIAHVLMNSMRPPAQRKPLDDLWKKVVGLEFHSRDLRTRGIRRIDKKIADGS